MLQRQFFAGGAAVVQGALSAQHFLVQCVALEIADHPAIEVELMHMAAAVEQVVELALVGQGQGFQMAQGFVSLYSVLRYYWFR